MNVITKVLIDCVKQYPVIYDPDHDDYKNAITKDEAWDEIGKKLNQDVFSLKSKWKNIKDMYTKHLRSLKSTGRESKYTDQCRQWIWAREMEFFRPYHKSFSAESDEATKRIAFEHISIDKGDIEDNMTFFNENEDVAYDCFEANIQNPIEVRRTQEERVKSHIFRVGNHTSRLTSNDNNGESFCDTTTYSDTKMDIESNVIVANEKEDTHDVSKQRRVEKEKSRRSGLDHFTSYLGNTEDNQLIFSDDAIDLLFLGLAESVKAFSSKRQAITKLKIANIVLQQEVQQRKEDINFSLSLNVSPTSGSPSNETSKTKC